MQGQRLFFFGSLMDPDVLEIVTGRAIDQTHLKPGTLEGYRCEREVKESYPVLVPCPGGKATVLIAEGLSETEIDRILFYETGEYDLVPFTVDDGTGKLEAQGFATGEGIKTSGDTWRLNVWQATEKSDFLPLASAFMAAYGKMSIPEALKYWDQLTEEFEAKKPRALKRGQSL
ncbi:gamma-glutamylcyclotransferase [Kiloniella laminariae]|uniref:Putative gamma-glutamylcyclotransferase n=1 Tax=Kiloniella laminariae TaxID=454162 RepID=A0ABT4LHL9_9PROT|nr:gamma-glutamylcyclotransferase family protein [Kiloniella laminariae]MCZ4280586.1 gamma-glutamylcyclotransferase [Kiloniella laminariae]